MIETEKTGSTDLLFSRDQFSQWLGIERVEQRPGYCKLRMVIRPEMCNGLNIAHGGICYSLADSALAFASNADGRKAVSVETCISHIRSLQTGEVITATAVEKNLGNSLGVYEVTIEKQNGKIAALFKGTVYFVAHTHGHA